MVTPHFADDWLTVYGGDVREVLPELASDSVDCIVTSPPYWGLRDYGTSTWSGGDAGCDHLAGPPASASNTLNGGAGWTPTAYGTPYRGDCGKCGATRIDSQLGLEATPEEYVANLVAVFRELRRVLKPSGTCWLNLGDSYNGSGSVGGPGKQHTNGGSVTRPDNRAGWAGLKPKDLVGIPWRVAFALQADGWYLRSDIIWAKPNPMPESVTDRPTKAHEYLFLLTKSPRYYFDQEAVREPALYEGTVVKASNPDTAKNGQKGTYGATAFGFTQHDTVVGAGRNLRSVWTIATRPYPGAHFAVFPPELPERCIKAGSSERGVCPECGAPWERVVERTGADMAARYARGEPTRHGLGGAAANNGSDVGAYTGSRGTIGWQPTCDGHGDPDRITVPATILDPFAGSGTVGLVANRLSRRAILIDLNPAYLEQQMKRNAQVPVGL